MSEPSSSSTLQLRRRLWWSLVILDWQYAPYLQNTYCIQRGQFDTAIPLNSNLEDLKDSGALHERPEKQRTSASLLRAKCVIAEATQKLVSDMSFSHIAEGT